MGQGNGYLSWGQDVLYYPVKGDHSEVCGEWILCQTSTCASRWTRIRTEQRSRLLRNGFSIRSIIIWSIWFVQLWWTILNTGKNDLTQCITHREAVFGSVIHSIFDTWHYQVLWTCPLTRLLSYTCNYVRLILYIMLHSTNLKPICQMHCFASSQVRSEVHSWLHSTVHSQPVWLTLSRRFQVNSTYTPKYSSEYILKYTPGHALQDAPKSTR